MHRAMFLACLLACVGCARSAIDIGGRDAGGNGSSAGQNNGGDDGGANDGPTNGANTSGGDVDGGSTDGTNGTGGTNGNGGANTGGTGDGGEPGGTTAGNATTGGDGECDELPTTCETAMSLGTIDASDKNAKVTRMGAGSGWFAIDLSDGNMDATSTSRIGLRATLSATAGATYSVTIMGDTSPDGGGRCVTSDVSDTTPLAKTAIWGSFGPTAAMKRLLAIHVEKLTGTCDSPWTLTLSGNPCPAFIIATGEASMGSCD